MASKVYFMGGRSESPEAGLVPKMLTVFDAAGFGDMIKPGDVVAIKVHCGEWNNTAYLRPVYPRALADRIKSLGGRPFVCDTTTLTYFPYAGRVTGLDIITTAERNGFTSAALGCPFIVADGFLGNDDFRVDLPEGFILKEAYIAQAIARADVLIALTHFKGHPLGVIGGSIKNLGVGAQSKRGKHNVHMGGHPRYGLGAITNFRPELCRGRAGCPKWRLCEDCCPWGLFKVTEHSIEWRREECTNCLSHLTVNVACGVLDMPKENFEAAAAAMADGCLGAVKVVGRDRVGFINMAIDITPKCDCVHFTDTPLVPDIGVFASNDPVAIDKACLDRVTESLGMPGSAAEDQDVINAGDRKFAAASALLSGLSEEIQINVGVRNGLGSSVYELIECEEGEPEQFNFPPDPRPTRRRFARMFAKEDPFPYERYEGKGFKRVEEVDFSLVR